MIRESRHKVPERLDGERLDRVAADLCTISRGEARRIVERGGAWVEGHRVRVLSRPVRQGQEVALLWADPPEEEPPRLEPSAIVFRHRGIVVVEKPAGVHAQAARHRVAGTLPDLVAALLPKTRPEPVHRLDWGTSGLVLFGLDGRSLSRLGRLLSLGRIEKGYLAVVLAPADLPDAGAWTEPLGTDPIRVGSVRVHASGDPARTEYRVVSRAGDLALLAVTPRTGRMHQIRVHAAHHGAPILGDNRYAPREALDRCPRLALHASTLRLPVEVTGAVKEISSPLPEALAGLVPVRG